MQNHLEELKKVLAYNPKTGVFTWLVKQKCGQVPAGSEAGAINPTGYRYIGYQGRRYLAHRLAWLFVHGKWPEGHLDHANGNPLDNRISNIRECSRSQNQANHPIHKNNRVGLKGVSFVPAGIRRRKTPAWRANIGHNGKQIYLGSFSNPEDAHAAYRKKAKELYGAFARHK